jgi:hypothetical protein
LFKSLRSPLGSAAWIVEKLKSWSDSDRESEPALNMDQVLTDIMIYLVTDSVDTSIWFYRGFVDDQPVIRGRTAVPRLTVPTAKVSLPKESPPLDAPQSLIARYYNLVRYTQNCRAAGTLRSGSNRQRWSPTYASSSARCAASASICARFAA